jgi:hypothetical protein
VPFSILYIIDNMYVHSVYVYIFSVCVYMYVCVCVCVYNIFTVLIRVTNDFEVAKSSGQFLAFILFELLIDQIN